MLLTWQRVEFAAENATISAHENSGIACFAFPCVRTRAAVGKLAGGRAETLCGGPAGSAKRDRGGRAHGKSATRSNGGAGTQPYLLRGAEQVSQVSAQRGQREL